MSWLGTDGRYMVLRCSLLGHDFDDPRMERDREIRGSEVVVTVEEYEECRRCNERNVLSENTEVTTLVEESPSEPEGDADVVDTGSADTTSSPSVESEPPIPHTEDGEPIVDDGEILEDDPDQDRSYGEWPAADDVGDGHEPEGAGDEENTSGETKPWPDSDNTEETEGTGEASKAWPDADDEQDDAAEYVYVEDEGTAGSASVESGETDSVPEKPTGDDAVFIDAEADTTDSADADDIEPASPDEESGDASSGPTGAVDTTETDNQTADTSTRSESHGQEPSTQPIQGTDRGVPDGTDPETGTDTEPTDADYQRPATDSATSSSPKLTGTGFESAAPAPSPGTDRAPEGTATELFCPRCEFAAAGDRGSLRPGDICPDCHRGYLSERPR